MDERILLAGIIPLMLVACGCILIGYAYSFPFEVIIGLLMMTLPILFLIWFLLVRVEHLAAGVRNQGRVLQRAFEYETSDMKRRYEESMRQIMDMHTDLTRRVYR